MAVEHWEELTQEFLTNFFRFFSIFCLISEDLSNEVNYVEMMIYLFEPFNI